MELLILFILLKSNNGVNIINYKIFLHRNLKTLMAVKCVIIICHILVYFLQNVLSKITKIFFFVTDIPAKASKGHLRDSTLRVGS